MKSILTIITVLAVSCLSMAQVPVKLKLNHKLKDKSFDLNKTTSNDLAEDFEVTRLEYYISKISVTHDSGKVTDVKDVYALVHPSIPMDIDLGKLNVTNIEAINFSVGVDPLVNNEDPTQWPVNHPLAPKSPSMHWGWSAGYRFVAMEGKSGSSMQFNYEIHALGNKNYFDISIPTTSKDDNGTFVIELNADYTKALKGISVGSGLVNHGEDGEAKDLLTNFRNEVFSSLSGSKNTLDVQDVKSYKLSLISIYPNPSADEFNLNLDLPISGKLSMKVMDATGKTVISETTLQSNDSSITLKEVGVYFVSIYEDKALIATKRLIKI